MATIDLNASESVSVANPKVINLRCPVCHNHGAFHGISVKDITWRQDFYLKAELRDTRVAFVAGIRLCPTKECSAPIFVILKDEQLFRSFPPEVIEFDPSNIPPLIKESLEEAIKCHSNECFRACAIMVRRVLEEICADRGAKGNNLKKRIASLRDTVIIPEELLEAANELRLLGNDAAHVESKIYDGIGKEEAELSVELAKELLKAVYQYSVLVAKLRSLKKP